MQKLSLSKSTILISGANSLLTLLKFLFMISCFDYRTADDFRSTLGHAFLSNNSIASFLVYEFFSFKNLTISYYNIEFPTFYDFS